MSAKAQVAFERPEIQEVQEETGEKCALSFCSETATVWCPHCERWLCPAHVYGSCCWICEWEVRDMRFQL